jgi:hypothetical protein
VSPAAATSLTSSPTPASERRPSRWLALLLFACVGLVPAWSRAQTSPGTSASAANEGDLARARKSFQRGVQAVNRKDYTNAAALFEEALALHYAPATAYNLASALFELRRFTEAYNLLRTLLVRDDVPAAVRARAEELDKTLELEVARLNVVMSGDARDLSAQVDGAPLAAERLGRPFAVAPGKHEIVAMRAGEVVSRRELDIAVRTTALVDLGVIVAAAEPAPPPPPAPVAAPKDKDSWYTRHRKVLWISVAAGVVVVGAGVATALLVGGKDESTPPVRGDTGLLTW